MGDVSALYRGRTQGVSAMLYRLKERKRRQKMTRYVSVHGFQGPAPGPLGWLQSQSSHGGQVKNPKKL